LVRKSITSDIAKSEYLLAEAVNKKEIIKEIQDSIKNPSSKYQSFTVSCSG